MKTCECCGTQYDENAVYCPNCFALNQKESTAETQSPEIPENPAVTAEVAWSSPVAAAPAVPSPEVHAAERVVERAAEVDTTTEHIYKAVEKATGRLPKLPESDLPEDEPEEKKKPAKKKNKKKGILVPILISVLCVLVLAAGVMFFLLESGVISLGSEEGQTAEEQQPEEKEDAPEESKANVPCTGISATVSEFSLKKDGTAKITVTAEPADCTDPIFFISKNDAIVKVSDDGILTPVSDGETEILITCGRYGDTCRVLVTGFAEGETAPELPEEPEEPQEPENPKEGTPEYTPKEEPEEPQEPCLNYTDITLSRNREQVQLKVLHVGDSPVTWSSDKPEILEVDDTGLVTAHGTAQIVHVTAQVDGKTFTCIVRCNLGGKEGEVITVSLNHQDVTFTKVGEYFKLKVVYDEVPETEPEYDWYSTDEDVCVVNDDGVVHAVAKGTAYVYTYVDGIKLECIIRCNLPEVEKPEN